MCDAQSGRLQQIAPLSSRAKDRGSARHLRQIRLDGAQFGPHVQHHRFVDHDHGIVSLHHRGNRLEDAHTVVVRVGVTNIAQVVDPCPYNIAHVKPTADGSPGECWATSNRLRLEDVVDHHIHPVHRQRVRNLLSRVLQNHSPRQDGMLGPDRLAFLTAPATQVDEQDGMLGPVESKGEPLFQRIIRQPGCLLLLLVHRFVETLEIGGRMIGRPCQTALLGPMPALKSTMLRVVWILIVATLQESGKSHVSGALGVKREVEGCRECRLGETLRDFILDVAISPDLNDDLHCSEVAQDTNQEGVIGPSELRQLCSRLATVAVEKTEKIQIHRHSNDAGLKRLHDGASHQSSFQTTAS